MVLKNKDKYLKDGVDVKQLSREMFNFLVNDDIPLKIHIELFFEQSIKPTLTEDEKVILRNIFKGFDKIRRTSIQDGRHLEVYCSFNKIWYEFMYQHLFQFIQPGEEYKISDLLEE